MQNLKLFFFKIPSIFLLLFLESLLWSKISIQINFILYFLKLILLITSYSKPSRSILRKSTLSNESWAFGDHTDLNTWIQYELNHAVALSSRLQIIHQDKISGNNPMIMAPVQTANTENYGGKEAYLGLGANFLMHLLPGEVDRFGLEVLLPLAQDKNNLQMDTDYKINFGYQKSF